MAEKNTNSKSRWNARNYQETKLLKALKRCRAKSNFDGFVMKKVLSSSQVSNILVRLPRKWEIVNNWTGVEWCDSTDKNFEIFVSKLGLEKFKDKTFEDFLMDIGITIGISNPKLSNLKPIKHNAKHFVIITYIIFDHHYIIKSHLYGW